MPFSSTRGHEKLTASQAILRGLASDGGLYVPDDYPEVSQETLREFISWDYKTRASYILSLFLDDYTKEELDAACAEAYSESRFGGYPAPVKTINENTHVLELFHGPTLAFKDMALQMLPHLLTMASKKAGEKREVAILVATSGDTGKAALEGFLDVQGTSCTVYYPRGGVSPVQEAQMNTTKGSNTHVISVEGNFDDTQTGVKALFGSEEFRAECQKAGRVLSSANSMNFGRLVPQVVYYFSAYADLCKSGAIALGDKIDFSVPTGNFGDILACEYARRMGLPVRRMICASNKNKVLTDFFKSGVYDRRREFYKTNSPSMDILISSNLERLLYTVSGNDGAQVAEWMKELKENGVYSIGEEKRAELAKLFTGGYADEARLLAEIKRVFDKYGYLMDTHTAVASAVLEDLRNEDGDMTPCVIVSTANPYKFSADVLFALTGEKQTDGFASAEKLEKLSGVPVPNQVKVLPTLPRLHFDTCKAKAMGALALDFFKAKPIAR
ncbi:MAG: threonine synthase [Eubacteriales bacterium]|nr:threonine synthase [Eubacteriales bacterium]MDD3880782.1 threonine synthase [Eubacteriales bacterium]MDD4511851.1 threonine synthase [Eubacteriales bacterium]